MSNGFKDGVQFPFPLANEGKNYQREIKGRANAILSTLMGFRPSNYRAEIPSTEYSKHLRAMSEELAKLTFELERVADDQSFETVRSEFLYQVIGELVFLNDEIPDLDFDDEEFREFLLQVIEIYFQGATPESIRDAVELFTDESFEIKEKFKDARKSESTQGIGDQFEFVIEFEKDGKFPEDNFRLKKNINLLIQLVKPAHTLFASRNIFEELFDTTGETEAGPQVEAESRLGLKDRHYEDVRSYWQGMAGFESDQGLIEQSDKTVLKDNTKPLGRVAEGTELVVFSGTNTGIYRVINSDEDNNTVKVEPPFQQAEDPVKYSVKADRKGANEEITVTGESATHQFRPDYELEVNGNGPYTVRKGDDVQINATANYDKVQFEWDLSGDGTFDDGSGSSITVDTSQYNGDEVVIGVKGSSTIYGVEQSDLDEGEKSYYKPGSEDIDKVTVYLM